MKLQNVVIPTDGVILSDDNADNGLYLAFDKDRNLIGIVFYDEGFESYDIVQTTNGNELNIYGDTLEEFYTKLQERYRNSYLMYVKTVNE